MSQVDFSPNALMYKQVTRLCDGSRAGAGMLYTPLRILVCALPVAGVVKLADARDSKSRGVHSP